MKQSIEPGLLQRAIEVLRAALGPRTDVEPLATGDALRIHLPGGGDAYAPLAVWGEREAAKEDDDTVWVIDASPPSVRRTLRGDGINFIDVRGAVHLTLPGLLVDRDRVRLSQRAGRVETPFDPFADRSSLVVRTLLDQPGEHEWGVRELAAASSVAPATASRVVRALRRQGLVQDHRSGRDSRIVLSKANAQAVFEAWTRRYDWTRNYALAVQPEMGDPIRFLRRDGAAFGNRRWALTLQAGASLVAPHAEWDRAHVYVEVQGNAELVDVAEAAGWRPAPDGRLVLLRPYYHDSVWHGRREIDGLPVVHPLQLALDLWHYPLRGREQGEHLLRTEHLLG